MKLTFHKLVIENFGPYIGKHTFILDRGPGLFYLTGMNKANPELQSNDVGKSTIWDALLWCLFGRTGRDNKPGTAIVSWGTEKKTTKASLIFHRGALSYTIKRTRHPNLLRFKSHGLWKTIKQEEIPDILDMSETMFRLSVVLTQFGTMFLDLRPEAQSQMFNEALSLGVYIAASERAGEEARTYREELGVAVGHRHRSEGELSALRKQIKAEKETERKFLAERKQTLRKNEKELHKLERHLKNYEGWQIDIGDVKEKLASLRARLTEQELLNVNKKRIGNEIDLYLKSIKGAKVCPYCEQPTPVENLQAKMGKLVIKLHNIEKQLVRFEAKPLEPRIKKLEQAITDNTKQQLAINDTAYRVKNLKKTIQYLTDEENSRNKVLVQLKNDRDKTKLDIEEHNKVIEEDTRQAKVCEYWQGAFKEIRLNLIDQVLTELSMAATAHAEALGLEGSRIVFSTERETKSGGISLLFNALLYSPERKEPVKWQSHGGGVSQRWQLAVAFGLSEIVLARAGIEPSILVLDEPTEHMSPKGIDKLLEYLSQQAKELNKTIYIVEHHSLERGMFDGTIMVEKTEEGSHIVEK